MLSQDCLLVLVGSTQEDWLVLQRSEQSSCGSYLNKPGVFRCHLTCLQKEHLSLITKTTIPPIKLIQLLINKSMTQFILSELWKLPDSGKILRCQIKAL